MKKLINQHNFDVEGLRGFRGSFGGFPGVSTNLLSMFRQPYPSAWPAMPRAPRTGQLQRLAKLEMLPMFLSMVIIIFKIHIQSMPTKTTSMLSQSNVNVLNFTPQYWCTQFLVANMCTFWRTFCWQKKVVAYKKINIRYVWRCQS